MKRFIKLVMFLAISVVLTACGGSQKTKAPDEREQFNQAIKEGRLSDAETLLVNGKISVGFYDCCTMLIDEYLDIEDLDKAIYVFDKISSKRCSMYDMQWNSSTSEYSKKNSKKIYKQLINEDRFDDAWEYHSLRYGTQDYPGNAPDYFSYMTDVIVHLCSNNRKAEAQRFVTTHIHWFTKNVDQHEWGKDYPQYKRSLMQIELQSVIDSF